MHKLLKRTMAIVIGAALCLAGVGCSGEKETISGEEFMRILNAQPQLPAAPLADSTKAAE